jgi:carbon storage regulator
MLVLSRQRDETIMIGDDIEITVVDIRGDKVRLGITAPNTVPVHRKEVYEAIQRENREAAKIRADDLPNLPRASVGPGGKLGGGNVPPMRPGRSVIPVTRTGPAPVPGAVPPPAAAPNPAPLRPENPPGREGGQGALP